MADIRKNRIKELRESQKLTQKELAKLVDSDHTTVSKHENGARGLTAEDILRYSSVFKVESYELFFGVEEQAG